MTTNVAIYCRISDDRDGLGLGVDRQERDCRALAAARGWDSVEVFTDNDISAFSGKKRPAYIEMMNRIKLGEFQVLIAYASDRLHRSPRELEDFIDICNASNIDIQTVQAGDINLSTPDGRVHARILGAFARGESEKTSARIKRAALQKAMDGDVWTSGNRAFGYLDGNMELNEREAAAIRNVTQRFLAGESLNSLCRWLNENGYLTPANKPFRAKALRDILVSARISGRRSYLGEIVAVAKWPAIITVEEGEAVKAVFNSRSKSGPVARKYLLTGILVCGECGKKLIPNSSEGRVRYICRKDPVSGIGCGGIFVTGRKVEDFVVDAVLTRLNSPELRSSLIAPTEKPHLAGVHGELNLIDAKLIELAEMFAKGELSRAEFNAAKSLSIKRRDELERLLAQDNKAVFSDPKLGTPELIAQKWNKLNLDRQRAILLSILNNVKVFKVKERTNYFNYERLQPDWKF